MKDIFTHIYHFLAAQDLPTIMREFHKLDPAVIAKSIYTWLVVAPICIYLLWTKKFKVIIALASLAIFVLLASKTLAYSGGTVDLQSLLVFIGETVALIGLNVYLLFMRE